MKISIENIINQLENLEKKENYLLDLTSEINAKSDLN